MLVLFILLLAASFQPTSLLLTISALFGFRREYALVLAIYGLNRLFGSACVRLRDDVALVLAGAAEDRGDARSGRPRTKQPFGQSLWTFRPNTVEATVFKIVDGRLHSRVLMAHGRKGFTFHLVRGLA